ncbi:hypothetical protein AcW1_009421 [Taiwanofungus camphoratus]|nr:hypothetical protein AcW1_009421 [Antrodia cinnamomea]
MLTSWPTSCPRCRRMYLILRTSGMHLVDYGSLKILGFLRRIYINHLCVANANMCPGFQFVLTPDKPDEGDVSLQKVDAGLYVNADAPNDSRPHWASQRMWVEWKREREKYDPFDDIRPEFEATSLERQKARGQIISYAAKIFAHQHRKYLFTIMILRDYARILFWDRSGVAVTEKFNYRQQPWKLGEFLWRFAHLSAEQQGYDPTATAIVEGTEEYELMNRMARQKLESSDYIREYFQNSLDGEWTRWKLKIEEDVQEDMPESSTTTASAKRSRYFLVGKPHFLASGVAGRGTRGYVAIDLETKKFVFLKDAWRVNLPGIDKEGNVVRLLNEKEVKNIPTLVCHGDIEDQCTVVQDLWEDKSKVATRSLVASGSSSVARISVMSPRNEWNPLKSHTHYRLVTAEVGRPLSDFRKGRELVKVMYDCLIGHQQAVEKANILHRDISAGNLLIVEYEIIDSNGRKTIEWRGMLNDWELSKPLYTNAGEGGQRQPDRTGTWQFTSAKLLKKPDRAAEVPDELESFLHVLLYMGIKYLPHNCPDVGAFMYEYFDEARLCNGQYICGRRKWEAMRHGEIDVGMQDEPLTFQMHNDGREDQDGQDHPLNALLDDILKLFKASYRVLAYDNGLERKMRSLNKITTQYDADYDGFSDGESSTSLSDLDSSDSTSSLQEEASLKATRKVAARLDTHARMAKTLKKHATKTKWPDDDKTSDQLPPHFNYTKMQYRGTKRDSRDVEDGELPQSKRRLGRGFGASAPNPI